MGQASEFVRYLIEKSQSSPVEIYEKAKDCMCDYYAVTKAGAAANEKRWTEYLKYVGDGKVKIVGYDKYTDGKTAALINGFNAHSLELDDGQRFAMIHLGGSVISALYSAGMEGKIEKTDMLKGIVMGYEAACRLSVSMQPSHKKCGFHTAGTCGTVGAAIAVGFALKMDDAKLERVLTAAIAGATGILEIQEQKSEMKPYNIGRAAMDGLTAAYMGFTDFKVPDDILNGERGFMKLFSKECNPEKMTEKTDYFEIERIYVKPYASCRHCHSAIEAALELREQADIDNIEKIQVHTYHLAVKGHDHTEIAGTSSAKLSMPYSVAVALILGTADVSAFKGENISREDIKALAAKVKIIENEEFTAVSSKKRVARVDIFINNGKILSKQVDYAKGDPENPMSRKEIIAKAYSLLGDEAEEIVNKVYVFS